MAAERMEKDSFGDIAVPAAHYWGAQTQRSLQNFKIGSERMPFALIHALALIKKARGRVNLDLISSTPSSPAPSSRPPTR